MADPDEVIPMAQTIPRDRRRIRGFARADLPRRHCCCSCGEQALRQLQQAPLGGEHPAVTARPARCVDLCGFGLRGGTLLRCWLHHVQKD
jgi:hypothetical protein